MEQLYYAIPCKKFIKNVFCIYILSCFTYCFYTNAPSNASMAVTCFHRRQKLLLEDALEAMSRQNFRLPPVFRYLLQQRKTNVCDLQANRVRAP